MPRRRAERIPREPPREAGDGAFQGEGGELRHLPRRAQPADRRANAAAVPEVSRDARGPASGGGGDGSLHELPLEAHADRGQTEMKPRKPFLALVGEYTALAFLLPTATFVGWAIGKWL